MPYVTLEQAREFAKTEAATDEWGGLYEGVMILRALDGAGYGVAFGDPSMPGLSVDAGGYMHPAQVVEFLPYGGKA